MAFDPNKTNINESRLADWLREPIDPLGDLEQVPGVGPKNAELMCKHGVNTTHQLIGKFLLLKEPRIDCQTHCDAFYKWLSGIGVNSNRGNIVLAIAEKCELFIPGVYDSEAMITQ